MTSPDLANLAKRFAAIPDKVKAAVQPAVEKGGDELVARMKYLAPEKSGELRNSIRKEPGPVELSVTVVADAPDALYQEYGTKDMHRNSFFWPSVNTAKKRVKGRIDRAIGKAVREAFQ
jgi:HK97 gp10 family phage protein